MNEWNFFVQMSREGSVSEVFFVQMVEPILASVSEFEQEN